MKQFILIVFSVFSLCVGQAQINKKDSLHIIELNQKIDNDVVKKNIASFDSSYAEDFVFSHGSGRVEGKSGWMGTVSRSNYPLRNHDSVRVELHSGIAIVKGKMDIRKINKDKTDNYHLRYIRIYAWRQNRWQLISHNTTHEWHEQ